MWMFQQCVIDNIFGFFVYFIKGHRRILIFAEKNQYDLFRITLECNLFDNITYFPCHWKPNRISCEISQNIDWQSWQLFTVFLDRVLKNTLKPISLVMFLHKNKSIFKVAIKNFLFLIFRRTPANKWYIKKYARLQ